MRRDWWATLEKLPYGVAGTREALSKMANFVRRDKDDLGLREFALKIVGRVPGHQFSGEAKKLFDYTRSKIIYRRAPYGTQLVSDARRTLKMGVGDCAMKSVLLATLLACIGHPSRFVVLSYDGQDYQHVCIETWLNGEWVPMDPTPELAQMGWLGHAVRVAKYPIF